MKEEGKPSMASEPNTALTTVQHTTYSPTQRLRNDSASASEANIPDNKLVEELIRRSPDIIEIKLLCNKKN